MRNANGTRRMASKDEGRVPYSGIKSGAWVIYGLFRAYTDLRCASSLLKEYFYEHNSRKYSAPN